MRRPSAGVFRRRNSLSSMPVAGTAGSDDSGSVTGIIVSGMVEASSMSSQVLVPPAAESFCNSFGYIDDGGPVLFVEAQPLAHEIEGPSLGFPIDSADILADNPQADQLNTAHE